MTRSGIEVFFFKLKQKGVRDNLLSLIENYLSSRYQRTVINGKTSSWLPVEAGPFLFLVHINDFISGMKSYARIFADDTALFVIVDDPLQAYHTLCHDLNLVEEWAYQWRMSFNPDPTKPPIKVIFSTKHNPPVHPSLYFNGVLVNRVNEHKHLGLALDKKLTFNSHISLTSC